MGKNRTCESSSKFGGMDGSQVFLFPHICVTQVTKIRRFGRIANEVTINQRPKDEDVIGHCIAFNNVQNPYPIVSYKTPQYDKMWENSKEKTNSLIYAKDKPKTNMADSNNDNH